MILGITGPPQSGKTTISEKLEATLASRIRVVHTDKWKGAEWKQIPAAVRDHVADIMAESMEDLDVVVEGVQVARAIRHGMPCDLLIVLTRTLVVLDRRQAGLGKSIERWLDRLSPLVPIRRFDDCQAAFTAAADALGVNDP